MIKSASYYFGAEKKVLKLTNSKVETQICGVTPQYPTSGREKGERGGRKGRREEVIKG